MKEQGEGHSFWISYTDLITGFLIVFVVITLVLQMNIDKDGKRRAENGNLKGYFKEKVEEFENKNIQVLDDGAIRFISGESDESDDLKLFSYQNRFPTNTFENILESFAFTFFDKVAEYYRSNEFEVREIRIEGHADSRGQYFRNIPLSNNRALEVYKYIYRLPDFESKYSKELLEFIKQKIVVVGFGPSRLVDSSGEYITESNQPEDYDLSRRVEFRIIIEPI